MARSSRTTTRLVLPLLVLLCMYDKKYDNNGETSLLSPVILLVEAANRGGSRVRGEAAAENNNNNRGSKARRELFAERLSDPSNPVRGGAGGAAKEFQEFVPMRNQATVSPAPTDPPTTDPPTDPPTNPPTPPPTVALTNPPTDPPVSLNRNDQCINAVGPMDITPQGFGDSRAILYADNTIGAQIPEVTPDRCNRITNSSPGVWYKVIGTGERMTVSVCWPGTTFDSKLTVYSGQCGSVMTCATSNDDASGNFGACSINLQASRAQWQSTVGEEYHILIHGFGSRVGNFELNVINHTPLNDFCENAQVVEPGFLGIGTTFQANVPFDAKGTNCAGSLGLIGDSSGVWYKVTGTGGVLEASTCNPQTAQNFDTKIHIFDGSCDNSGDCIAGNDNYQSPNRCSLVRWSTQAGSDYYILVHGFLFSNGLFELSVDSV